MLIENGRIGQINIFKDSQDFILNPSLHFIYGIQGEIKIFLNDKEFILASKELIVLPANENSKIISKSSDVVYMDVSINKDFLRYYHFDDLIVSCSPNDNDSKKYHELLYLLNELYTDFVNENVEAVSKTIITLIMTLKAGFSNRNNGISLKRRINNYLQQNFTEDINLENTAKSLSITPQYLSNYFRKNFNKTFLKYLTDLRLYKSTQLLKNADLKIVNIAYDCGFNSISTFNRLFKKKFDITPIEWRKNHKEKDLQKTVKNINWKAKKLAKVSKNEKNIKITPGKQELFTKKVSASYVDIDNLNIENELQSFQELKLSTLFFDFNYKIKNLQSYVRTIESKIGVFIKNNIKIVVQITLDETFSDQKIIFNLVSLFKYFANLISIKRVRKWGICISGLSNISSRRLSEFLHQIQVQLFNPLGIKGDIYYHGSYTELTKMDLNEKVSLLLDIEIKKTNIDTFHFYVNSLRKITDNPIFLSGVSTFHDQFNLLNDTEIRANFFLRLQFNNFDEVDGIVINSLIDQGEDNTNILSGKNGIETKGWLPKPVYHAIDFLNSQGFYLLEQGKDHIITWNGENDYSILLVNPISFSEHHFELTYDNYVRIIKGDSRQYLLNFSDLRPGDYKLKIRKLGFKEGNIINSYRELGFLKTLNLNEFNYLKEQIQPKMIISKYRLDRDFNFSCTLQKGEIAYLHLIYLY